jgi:small-conductance mechanosensitive channel
VDFNQALFDSLYDKGERGPEWWVEHAAIILFWWIKTAFSAIFSVNIEFPLVFLLKNIFLKNIFLIFLNYFNALISKINLKNKKNIILIFFKIKKTL